MRIVIHLDKRTERRPCVFDVELNVSPKDHPTYAEFGRQSAERLRVALAEKLGFEPSRKRLRGVPSVILRYLPHEGRFAEPDMSAVEFAPHVRVAFANLMNTIEAPECGEARAERPCKGCRHYGERTKTWYALPFGRGSVVKGRNEMWCGRRGASLSLTEFQTGCADYEEGKTK